MIIININITDNIVLNIQFLILRKIKYVYIHFSSVS